MNKNQEDTKLYTVEQVAGHLQVSPETVRRWLNAGKLKGDRAGWLWRIPGPAVEAFKHGNATATADQTADSDSPQTGDGKTVRKLADSLAASLELLKRCQDREASKVIESAQRLGAPVPEVH